MATSRWFSWFITLTSSFLFVSCTYSLPFRVKNSLSDRRRIFVFQHVWKTRRASLSPWIFLGNYLGPPWAVYDTPHTPPKFITHGRQQVRARTSCCCRGGGGEGKIKNRPPDWINLIHQKRVLTTILSLPLTSSAEVQAKKKKERKLCYNIGRWRRKSENNNIHIPKLRKSAENNNIFFSFFLSSKHSE